MAGALVREQLTTCAGGGLEPIATLATSWLAQGKEHFGFRDGVSRTDIEGVQTAARREHSVAAGEFVLGYLNAYGQYTGRPLLTPERDPRGLLLPAPDDAGRRDLGMNGSYLVFRQLSHFICFNTHIGRQFEFIQHTWLNIPKFDGLYEDDDPLAGDRGGGRGTPGGGFPVQADPVRTRVTGMPRVSHVRGGGYFFMPGIRAVRFLASLS